MLRSFANNNSDRENLTLTLELHTQFGLIFTESWVYLILRNLHVSYAFSFLNYVYSVYVYVDALQLSALMS